jgi:tetratricopeptide (TPR) repeat protein
MSDKFEEGPFSYEGLLIELSKPVSDDAAAPLERAPGLVHAKDSAGAIQKLREAIRRQPDRADLRETLGLALENSGQPEEAIAEFRTALRLQPEVEKFIQLGSRLEQAGKLDEAVALYREGLKIFPQEDRLYFRLALGLADTNRRDEAIAAYRDAIRLNPMDDGYHLNLAHLLAESGKLDETLPEYTEAVRLAPDNIVNHVSLGALLAEMERFEEAEEILRQAVGLVGEEDRLDIESSGDRYFAALARYHLAMLLKKCGRSEEAIEQLQEVGRSAPDIDWSGPLLYVTGEQLDELGRPTDARSVWERVLTLDDAETAERARIRLALSEGAQP